MKSVLPDSDVANDGSSTSSMVSQGSSSSMSDIQTSAQINVPNENEIVETATTSVPRSGFLYGFCLLACFTAFIALLIRRIGSA